MKFRLKYKHNGREIITTRTAETAFAAAEKLCDQYNWRCKLLQYDADTRGLIWAEAFADTDGGYNYSTLILSVRQEGE